MKTLSLKEYLGGKHLPKVLTTQDMILWFVNREAGCLISDEEKFKLPEYEVTFTRDFKLEDIPAGLVNFARQTIKSVLP